jgi:hypothetical protein
MFRLFIGVMPLVAAAPLVAQTPATTFDGKAVMLYDNGTWKYAAADTVSRPATGSAPSAVRDQITILDGKAILRYDPNKWRETPSDHPGRFMLTHVKGDGLAMVIAEHLDMQIDTLVRVALENARSAAPDVQVLKRTGLRVKGKEMVEMQFSGTLRGVPFTYLGRYYSGKEGSFQVLTFTGTSLFAEYEADFRELLGGFEVPQ